MAELALRAELPRSRVVSHHCAQHHRAVLNVSLNRGMNFPARKVHAASAVFSQLRCKVVANE
jgi:hypothetical protein